MSKNINIWIPKQVTDKMTQEENMLIIIEGADYNIVRYFPNEFSNREVNSIYNKEVPIIDYYVNGEYILSSIKIINRI